MDPPPWLADLDHFLQRPWQRVWVHRILWLAWDLLLLFLMCFLLGCLVVLQSCRLSRWLLEACQLVWLELFLTLLLGLHLEVWEDLVQFGRWASGAVLHQFCQWLL